MPKLSIDICDLPNKIFEHYKSKRLISYVGKCEYDSDNNEYWIELIYKQNKIYDHQFEVWYRVCDDKWAKFDVITKEEVERIVRRLKGTKQ